MKNVNLYKVYHQAQKINQPTSIWLEAWANILEPTKNWSSLHRTAYANTVWWRDLFKTFPKPSFDLNTLHISGKDYEVVCETKAKKPFCNLLKFSLKGKKRKQILIVAPMSGHYSTLLRDTVKRALYDHDVWITDWLNVRDIPEEAGDFTFSSYVDYVIDFFGEVKKEGSFGGVAVCQPTVPVMTAIAHLEGAKLTKNLPVGVALLGGPLDTRVSPTQVNEYAVNKDLEWFQNNVIFEVPTGYAGAGRMVYPGFLQHSGFVAMNMKKHAQAQVDFFEHLLQGADLSVEKHQRFYDEYNAVMDLPASYYLETLENVFFDQKLAKGTLKYKGKEVSLASIKNVKVFTVEGELDDISGPNQTHGVLKLCTGLPAAKKKSKTFAGVGHYGIFSGKSWREKIYPEISKVFAD